MNGAGAVQTRYRVLYGDVDAMGVMYYGNYFRLFERGRGEYMRARGLPYREIESKGLLLPVTEAHCHYLSSVEYDDRVLIETRIAQIRRASVRFEYEIFRHENGKNPLVTGYTMHACVTPEKKIVRLPQWLLDSLGTESD